MTGWISELPLTREISLGSIRIYAIESGVQRLDGGAMFGVVPKPLWERRIPPDKQNRIPLALRCLVVETPDELVLVDTGIGNKESKRFHDLYGIENAGNPTRLEDGIQEAGFIPEDISIVLCTHLHFDHAGGNTFLDLEGKVRPAFENARYIVQRGEFDFAHNGNERIRASYLPDNFDPIEEAGLWDFVEGYTEIIPGVSVMPTPGHTPYHQSVVIESDGETACFLADVCPTTAHIQLPWIMGYDLDPLVTLESKRKLWSAAREQEWLLIFEHDLVTPWGRLDPDSDRPQLRDN